MLEDNRTIEEVFADIDKLSEELEKENNYK
jgi:hypothetical protein